MPFELSASSLRWLNLPEHQPIDGEWVPGASVEQLQALNALGGVARHLLGDATLSGLHPDLARWFQDAPSPPPEVLSNAREIFELDRDQALANMYAQLVRSENRRQLGTFFTPAPEVRLMLDLWDESEQPLPQVVVDVGAGVGVFTAEAAERWPSSQIYALDINPVTLGLLAVRLLGTSRSGETTAGTQHRIQLVLDDFTTWVSSNFSKTPRRRLILGNPPYTRAQLLSRDERQRLHLATNRLCGTRASLSTIITALSLQNLEKDDGLCLLLPAQWLEADYARGLREELWAQSHRRIELRLVDSEMFADAQVDAVALLVGVEQAEIQPFTVGRWKKDDLREIDRSNPIPQSWRAIFDTSRHSNPGPIGELIDDDLRAPACRNTISDVAIVHRGVATGANSFFVMGDDRRSDFPKEATTRVITRLFDVADDLAEEDARVNKVQGRQWLLTCSPAQVATSLSLSNYIGTGIDSSYHLRYLCSKRSVWYDLRSELFVPDVILGAMTRSDFKIVENSVSATITNNLYGLKWRPVVDRITRERVLEWLRSDTGQDALRHAARRQGNGLIKIEPGGLREVALPDELFR